MTPDEQTNMDIMVATYYAWGRSDAGDNLDASEIYKFGTNWARIKREFAEGLTANLPSLQSSFEGYFQDVLRKRLRIQVEKAQAELSEWAKNYFGKE